MPKKETITLELTPAQAKVIRWALTRAHQVTGASQRGLSFWKHLEDTKTLVDAATDHLEPLPLPKTVAYKGNLASPKADLLSQ